MNFILNGKAQGDVASKLLDCNFDVRALRPFVGQDGKSYLTVNNSGKEQCIPISNTTATLRKDEWKLIDETVIGVAKSRLKAVADLRAAGLTYNIPNGMGTTVLSTERVSDINPAAVSMDGMRENANDRAEFDIVNLPLPIIHKDFSFSARQIASSRSVGAPLDLTMADLAARRVAEEAEKLLLGKSSVASEYSFGGGKIWGYTDYEKRSTKSMTVPTASGWTGETLLSEVLDMKAASIAKKHYGPWMLYISPNWDKYIDNDFKAASDKSIRQRISEVSGISDIRTLDYLEDYDMVMVQMTSDVVRLVIGMEVVTVEWDSHGGLMKNFKVMTIMVPQLRSDQEDNCGIVHGRVVG